MEEKLMLGYEFGTTEVSSPSLLQRTSSAKDRPNAVILKSSRRVPHLCDAKFTCIGVPQVNGHDNTKFWGIVIYRMSSLLFFTSPHSLDHGLSPFNSSSDIYSFEHGVHGLRSQ